MQLTPKSNCYKKPNALLRLLVLFLFISFTQSFAQTKNNLDKIFGLIDRSVIKIDSVIAEEKTIVLIVSAPPALEILNSRIFHSFAERGVNLKSENRAGNYKIHYTLLNSKVDYKNARKDGFFGDVLIDRIVMLNSSAIITKPDGAILSIPFDQSEIDTITLDEIGALENQSLPFTQSQIPQVPLFSNLFEPIIVVGTLILTVILLFTVRSK